MSEDIKEILENQKVINAEDNYEKIIFEYLVNNCSEFSDEHIKQLVNLKVKQYKQLLDYITNLQEENERLKERENKLQEKFKDWKKGIEKERRYYLCERTDCCGRIKDSKKYNSVYQEKEDYKSRCEKAIARIKLLGKYNGEYCTRNFKMMSADFNDLLNILQGSDKE